MTPTPRPLHPTALVTGANRGIGRAIAAGLVAKGCRVTVGGKVRFACVDGPDFDGHEVDFDELMKRNGSYRAVEAEKKDHVCRLLGVK